MSNGELWTGCEMIITWTCHICGQERPDEQISVHKRDVSKEYGLPAGTMKENVRYCNDNPDCTRKAETFRLIRGKK